MNIDLEKIQKNLEMSEDVIKLRKSSAPCFWKKKPPTPAWKAKYGTILQLDHHIFTFRTPFYETFSTLNTIYHTQNFESGKN